MSSNSSGLPRMFAVCDGIFDESSNTYQPNTPMGQTRCCLNLCKPGHDYCNNECNNNIDTLYSKELNNGDLNLFQAMNKCKNICTDSYNICSNTCKLLSPEFKDDDILLYDKIYHECVTKYCPIDINLDHVLKCVKKHKSSIINCCTEKTGNNKLYNFHHNKGLLQSKLPVYNSTNIDKTSLIVIVAVICAIVVIPLLIKDLIFGIIAIIISIIIMYKIK
jgi:hypothetical protein